MNDKEQKDAEGVLAGILVIPSLFTTAVVRGLVGQQLWAWFVVEPFGLSAITLETAVGLSLLLWAVFPHRQTKSRDHSLKDWSLGIVGAHLFPVLLLGAAWVFRAVL